jgi:hypothetical protein
MTELNCSLRSRQIALEADGVVVARKRKSVSARSSSIHRRAI